LTAIILVGGKGTRISALVPDLPKPLVPVAGKPFLHWVLRWVALQGEVDVLLAAQHLAEKIVDFAAVESHAGLSVRVCVEPTPLGTGGAVMHAAASSPDSHYLVLNGDSVALMSLRQAYDWLAADPTLDGVIAGVRLADAARFGSLAVGDNSLLRGFHEKRPGAGLVNAGLYLLRAPLLRGDISAPQSMETDLFPRWLAQGRRIGVVEAEVPFIDIGTPESLGQSTAFIESIASLLDGGDLRPATRSCSA